MPGTIQRYLAGAFIVFAAFVACALILGLDAAVFLLACAAAVWLAVRVWNLYRLWKSVKASREDETAMAIEKMRLKNLLFKFGFNVVTVGVFVLGVAMCVRMEVGTNTLFLASLAATICSAPFMMKADRYWSRYKDEFKEKLVSGALSGVFDDFRYEPLGAFDRAVLDDLGFFVDFDWFNGNDLIEAKYRGIRFVQGDIRLGGASGSVFFGRVVRFDFVGGFSGPVQVVQKGFTGAKVRSGGEWRRVEGGFSGLADDFDIFARDSADAAAALTPAMAEAILSLRRRLLLPTALYFAKDAMFAFLSLRHDSFDVSDGKTLLEERERLDADVSQITHFLDSVCLMHPDAAPPPLPTSETTETVNAPDAEAETAERVAEMEKLRCSVTGWGRTALLHTQRLVFAGYALSLLYAFIAFGHGITLGFSYSGGEFSLHGPVVPILVYILAINGFFVLPFTAMACFSSKSVIGSAVLSIPMLVHLWFLYINATWR